MKFLVFAASHRPESYNRKLAACTARFLAGKGHDVDFAEYAEFDMPAYNDAVELPPAAYSFGNRAASCQGIIVSAPEYNWSYPGSLKSIIDWTSCIKPHPLRGKTALLMSASPGTRGGILGLSHLKTPMEASHLFVFPRVFPLGSCESAFDSDGALGARPNEHLHILLHDYVTFTGKLTNTP